MSKDQVRQILRQRGLNVRKKYGQNFLIDSNIIEKILRVTDTRPEDVVIEIGPGLGALTKGLSRRSQQVIAFEIDAGLSGYLKDEFSNLAHVQIHQADFLDVELAYDTPVTVVSNLPYYITTPILFKLLEADQAIERIVLMMQKEVAERLVATPRTKQYNALSVILQYLADVKIEFHVPKTCFYPVPDVDSSVVKITVKDHSGHDDVKPFITFVKNAFHQRRKTLLNNLSSTYNYKKVIVEQALGQLELPAASRAEELTLSDFMSLYETLKKMEK
jgi:16S rRNA (adenine1518-N6/adenine1519-N6)-dimethyltransferase